MQTEIMICTKPICAVGTTGYNVTTAKAQSTPSIRRGGMGAMRTPVTYKIGGRGELCVCVGTMAGPTKCGRVANDDPAYLNCVRHAQADCLLTVLNLLMAPDVYDSYNLPEYDADYTHITQTITHVKQVHDCNTETAIDHIMTHLRNLPQHKREALGYCAEEITSDKMHRALRLHYLQDDKTLLDIYIDKYGVPVDTDIGGMSTNDSEYKAYYNKMDEGYAMAYNINPDKTVALCKLYSDRYDGYDSETREWLSWRRPDMDYVTYMTHALRQGISRILDEALYSVYECGA